MSVFGDRLRDEIVKRGLSYNKASKLIGVDRSTINRVINSDDTYSCKPGTYELITNWLDDSKINKPNKAKNLVNNIGNKTKLDHDLIYDIHKLLWRMILVTKNSNIKLPKELLNTMDAILAKIKDGIGHD